VTEIPSFDIAVADFVAFLSRRGHPTSVTWVFREDLRPLTSERVLVRRSLPAENQALAQKVFSEGRVRGIVGIDAVAQGSTVTLATVWFPKFPEDELQGWSANLKLAIHDPLPRAYPVPSFLWRCVRATAGYKRYQAQAYGIGTRQWAAA
jgi:hypothetical protein